MWTYLTILLSAAVLIGVFVHRAILVRKAGIAAKEKPVVEEEVVEEIVKKRLPKDDKAKLASLCEKADIKLKVGKEEEAIQLLVQALAIDENHQEAQHKLAMLYMQKQMFGAAAALFKRLGDMTDEAVHFSHLGLALYQQNEFEEAKRAYQKAVFLDDSRPQRFASLASVYRSLGNPQNAIIALNKGIELDQENIDFLILLADLLIEQEDFDRALKALAKVLELDPDNEVAKEYQKKTQAIMSATKDDVVK